MEKEKIINSAKKFFKKPFLVDISFFLKNHVCKKCHQSLNLFSMIILGNMNDQCSYHSKSINSDHTFWTCCKKSYRSNQNDGCMRGCHDIHPWLDDMLKQIAMKKINYPFIQTNSIFNHLSQDNMTLNIPFDMWFSIFYYKFNGSIHSFLKSLDKYINDNYYHCYLFKNQNEIKDHTKLMLRNYSSFKIYESQNRLLLLHDKNQVYDDQSIKMTLNHGTDMDSESDECVIYNKLKENNNNNIEEEGEEKDMSFLFGLIIYSLK